MAAAGRPIGLALSGGAAHGLAHIPILEAFDELGIRPTLIAGTSMGAIIGAAYAGGADARAIADYVAALRADRRRLMARLWASRPRTLHHLFGPYRATAGQLDAEAILAAFAEPIPEDFAALRIPLKVVVTDFYAGREVVLTSGGLRKAVAASMALPLLFRPVVIDGRGMVDGGVLNPLPLEHATMEGGILVAVDVVGTPPVRERPMPRRIEAIMGAIQLTMRQITVEKLKGPVRPDILVDPPIDTFRPLEFSRAAEIIAAGRPAKEDLKRQLDALLR